MGARDAGTRKGLASTGAAMLTAWKPDEARAARECPAWTPGDSEVPASIGAEMPTAWLKMRVPWLPPSAPTGILNWGKYCLSWVQQRSCKPEPLQQACRRETQKIGVGSRGKPQGKARMWVMASQSICTTLEGTWETLSSLVVLILLLEKLRPESTSELAEVSQCSVAEPRLERWHWLPCPVHVPPLSHSSAASTPEPRTQVHAADPSRTPVHHRHDPPVPSRNFHSEPGMWKTEEPCGVEFLVCSCSPASIEEDDLKK